MTYKISMVLTGSGAVIVVKVVLTILLLFVAFVVGGVSLGSHWAAVSAEMGFFPSPVFEIIPAVILALAIALVWLHRNRRFVVVAALLIAVCFAAMVGNFLYGNARLNLPSDYDEDLASVVEEVDYGIDVTEYLPFTSNKIARLQEPSTLQFAKDAQLPRMDAAVALVPTMSSFATACYPEKSTTVAFDYEHFDGDFFYWPYYSDWSYMFDNATLQFNNSGEGFQSLAVGNSDVFFGTYASEEQVEFAKDEGVEFEYTPIGLDGFVFLVNEQNSVDSLTADQVRSIYSGEVTDWSQVSGSKGHINAYQRNEGSGSQSMMEKFMGEVPLMEAPSNMYASSMGGIVKVIAYYDNGADALGYSFRYYATELVGSYPIKLLAIDGVDPTLENIAEGSYPITEPFFAVTRKGDLEAGRAQLAADPDADTMQANLARLIDWVLSDQGQYLVEQSGYARIQAP